MSEIGAEISKLPAHVTEKKDATEHVPSEDKAGVFGPAHTKELKPPSPDENAPKEINYLGITDFPEPLANPFSSECQEKWDRKREDVYKELAHAFPEGRAYLPGSGADPVPFRAFGDRILYGSKRDAEYFKMLKDPEYPKPSLYSTLIAETPNTDNVQAVWADLQHAPFSDGVFNIILLHDLPVSRYGNSIQNPKTVQEITRILDKDGVLVLDNWDDVGIENDAIKGLLQAGYTLNNDFDSLGGITNVMYQKGQEGHIPFFGEEINREEFLAGLAQKRQDIHMLGNRIRVLNRPVQITT